MKLLTLTAGLVFAAQAANAQTTQIECSFTEPFYSIEVDLKKREVTMIEPDWESDGTKTVTKVIGQNIAVKVLKADPFLPKFQILDGDKSVILDLTMNMAGSDGMSNRTYPLEAKHGRMIGGCSTNLIKHVEASEGEG